MSVCFNTFIKHLVDEFTYTILSFGTTVSDYEKMIQTKLDARTILKFGPFYIVRLQHETVLQLHNANCMILPFVKQFCRSNDSLQWSTVNEYILTRGIDINKNMFLDASSEPVQSKKPDLFIIGYDKLNWCKIISSALVSFPINPLTNEEEIHLNFLCALKPHTKNAEKQLEVLMKCSQKTCDRLKIDVVENTKLGLGQLLLFYVIQTYQKTHKYIKLECDKDLVYYYYALNFRVGPSPKFVRNLPFLSMKGSHKKQEIQRIILSSTFDEIKLEDQKNFSSIFLVNPNVVSCRMVL